ncbi:hypothetical protein Bhyg_03357 [Pseudolycoriella hygida]|uniref:Uncharacterized protein n=1 Tax=Pseudolycoriella hygida TaxID=35572 RepID=A0A9Q0NDZ3_9DIPT|nr:hypothetical protein Bhyg_03357 [Pseudolycoriella hygida]
MNDDGMPIPYSFMARNTRELQHYINNEVSSNEYEQMAQSSIHC